MHSTASQLVSEVRPEGHTGHADLVDGSRARPRQAAPVPTQGPAGDARQHLKKARAQRNVEAQEVGEPDDGANHPLMPRRMAFATRGRIGVQGIAIRCRGGHGSLGPVFFLLKHDVHRLLVLAQPQERGVAHLAGARPLGEFHLGDKLRFHPGGRCLVLYALFERR